MTGKSILAKLRGMLKIRLQRVGRKNDPSFRLIVTDHKKDSQSGKFIEILGHYDARSLKGERVQIKGERVKYWLSVGAQASDTVHNLLVSQKVIDAKKRNVLPKRKPAALSAEPPVAKITEAVPSSTASH